MAAHLAAILSFLAPDSRLRLIFSLSAEANSGNIIAGLRGGAREFLRESMNLIFV